jgi:transcriptional regulator with XRE-family HTH domain
MKNTEVDMLVEKIVRRIKELRVAKNLKQDYLAAKLGCSQNSYSKLELGRTELSLRRLLEIAHILEIRVPELFE